MLEVVEGEVEGEVEVVFRPDNISSYGRTPVSQFVSDWRKCSHLDTWAPHKPPCNQRNKVCLEFL